MSKQVIEGPRFWPARLKLVRVPFESVYLVTPLKVFPHYRQRVSYFSCQKQLLPPAVHYRKIV